MKLCLQTTTTTTVATDCHPPTAAWRQLTALVQVPVQVQMRVTDPHMVVVLALQSRGVTKASSQAHYVGPGGLALTTRSCRELAVFGATCHRIITRFTSRHIRAASVHVCWVWRHLLVCSARPRVAYMHAQSVLCA